MSRLTLAAVLALLGTTACLPATGVEAPYDAALILPENAQIPWSEDWNGIDDSVGWLFLMDVVVYSTDDGTPMDNIQVELVSNFSGLYLIPSTAVKLVGGPAEVDDSQCDGDGDGEVDDGAPDECFWHYDTSSNQYIQFASDFADVYHPNYMIGPTDERGVLRAYLYVDAMPFSASGESFGSVSVTAMLGHTSEAFTISGDTE